MSHSKQQIAVMRRLYPDNIISKSKLERRLKITDYHVMQELTHAGLIRKTTDFHADDVYLTESGKAYIEALDEDKKRYSTERIEARTALVFSAIALILATIALFK